jgi:allantoate deiminase
MTELYRTLLRNYDKNLNGEGINGERLAKRLSAIAEIGQTDEGGSYRLGFSKEERKAKNLVKKWMEGAGLDVQEDGTGNVFGRLSGKNNDLRPVLSGSHVDSVPDGGHFDGPLGVLSALEVVEAWKTTGYRPTRPYEVVIFTDEEGSRFNGGMIGSQAMMGEIKLEKQMALLDINGMPFKEVIENDGLSIDHFLDAKRDPKEIEAFVEVHIEQGKRLEKADVPVGIVTGIAGPCWCEISFSGKAGHAGNTPMNERNDALVAASDFILQVKSIPEKVSSSAVATVGKVNVFPNGVNVIPGEVQLYVDIRDIYEDTRDELVSLVLQIINDVSKKHGVSVDWKETMRIQPVPIKDDMQQKLQKAVENSRITPLLLPSGAGHDTMTLGRYLPVAMLFVRSKDGISHSPSEWSSLDDCIQGVHVLKNFIEGI